MKICFIAPASNYHTQKWCKYFVEQGHEVHVVSFQQGDLPGVTQHWIDTGAGVGDSDVGKLKYLTQGRKLKKCIETIQPDILNVHYATSYGTAAALAGIKHYVLSVWGSDIYEFPRKSIIHKWMLKYSLFAAERIFSTSQAMADEANKYTKKDITITPFGVNMELFHPQKRDKVHESFVIGTVKSLAHVYGIDVLLKATKRITECRPDIPLQVRIAGKGPQAEELCRLAKDLGIEKLVHWLGFISQEQAAYEWANMDIGVVPSRAESFGVSAVEAQACGRPVIITDIPGLKEATEPGKTSVVIDVEDVEGLAQAVIHLYDHQDELERMGKYGRTSVEQRFELNACFRHIENCFRIDK